MIARPMKLLVTAFAVAAVVAGCGGDDDSAASGSAGGDGSISTSSLSKAQFVKQANAACHDEQVGYRKEITLALERFRSQGLSEHDAAVQALQAVRLPISEAQVVAIQKLGAPSGDEEEIEAALDAQQEAIDEFKAAEPAEVGADPTKYFGDASKMLQGYGLNACVFTV
jgi:hypothetical protein